MGQARVLQPRHRRAGRHGRDDRARARRRRSSPRSPRSQPFWAQLSLEDRARYMRRAADVLVDELDDVAELLTREQGKPITESYTMEVVPTIDAPELVRRQRPGDPRRRADPHAPGAVRDQAVASSPTSRWASSAVIAPWNYPWSIPFGEVAIALMAGNGVVLKPASLTPLLGERIQSIFDRRRLPRGPRPHRPRRRRDRPGAVRVARHPQGLLHRLGRGRPQGRRDLRRAT